MFYIYFVSQYSEYASYTCYGAKREIFIKDFLSTSTCKFFMSICLSVMIKYINKLKMFNR